MKEKAPQPTAPSVCWVAASDGGLVSPLVAVRSVAVIAVGRRRRRVVRVVGAIAIMALVVVPRRQGGDGPEHAGDRAEHGRVAAAAMIALVRTGRRRRC